MRFVHKLFEWLVLAFIFIAVWTILFRFYPKLPPTPGDVMGQAYSVYHFPVIDTIPPCISSANPAVCGSSPAGFFVIAAAAGTVVVDTTVVTANSQIGVAEDLSLGSALGVTCNTATAPGFSAPTARTPGTSFTFAVTNAPATNPDCFSYFIIN